DQVNRQTILDAVLAEAVAILQDLPCKNQNQLVLFGFKPPRDLFFKLKDSNEERLAQKWNMEEDLRRLGQPSLLRRWNSSGLAGVSFRVIRGQTSFPEQNKSQEFPRRPGFRTSMVFPWILCC
ncbi:hypothetical protein FQN60_007447, partial [Etheostoma spectabile]